MLFHFGGGLFLFYFYDKIKLLIKRARCSFLCPVGNGDKKVFSLKRSHLSNITTYKNVVIKINEKLLISYGICLN